jgi:hypothetical protein
MRKPVLLVGSTRDRTTIFKPRRGRGTAEGTGGYTGGYTAGTGALCCGRNDRKRRQYDQRRQDD